MLQERRDSLISIFIERKIASEINIEGVTDELETFVPVKKKTCIINVPKLLIKKLSVILDFCDFAGDPFFHTA